MIDTVAYTRVSDPRQAVEEKTSLAAQRDAITALAARLGRTLISEGWYQEPGVSGARDDRPAFRRMIAYCQANPRPKVAPGYVLVYSTDRWGRWDDIDRASYWRSFLRQLDWIVRYAIDDPEEEDSAFLLRSVGALRAKKERETIARRAKTGMRRAGERGYWCNKAPFGYRRLAVDPVSGAERVLESEQRKGKHEYLRLVPGPADEVAFVGWAFDRYAAGTVTLSRLWSEAPHWIRDRFSAALLHRLLRNPTYTGDLVAGRRARTEELLVRDAFPPLVDRETFARVQELLARHRHEPTSEAVAYALSGLIHCGTCGQPLVGGGGRRDPATRFYRDKGSKLGICPPPMFTVVRRAIEPAVVDAVAGVLESHPIAELLATAFDRILDQSQAGQRVHQRDLDRAHQKVSERRQRIVDAIADGTLNKLEAAGKLSALRVEEEQIALARHRLQFSGRSVARLGQQRDALVQVALNFRAVAARLDGRDLRELLRPWIHRGTIDKTTRSLTLEINRVPAIMDMPLSPSADRSPQEQDTVTVRLRFKNRSEWATEREARRRAARRSA